MGQGRDPARVGGRMPGEKAGRRDSFPGSWGSGGCSPLLANHHFLAPAPSGRAPAKLAAGHGATATDGPERESPEPRRCLWAPTLQGLGDDFQPRALKRNSIGSWEQSW